MKTTARFEDSARRGGFTLIELMVVITIIAALMALTASAVMKMIEVQQTNNTQSTLDRTQGELNKAWSKVKDQAYRETIPPGIQSQIMPSLTGTDANATARMRVIYVKLRLRQAFPMNFTEAVNPSPLPPLSGYTTYLKNLGFTASTGANYESSACLLMALERGVSGAGVDPSSLTKGGATGSAPTPLGGSIPYLTDAWSRPIYFSRFPAGNLSLNPSDSTATPNNVYGTGTVICYSHAGANDPGDPQGFLQMPSWGTTYGHSFTNCTLQVLAAGNTSYKLAPMVASGGPVNWVKTGGTPPFDPTTFTLTTTSSGAMFSNP